MNKLISFKLTARHSEYELCDFLNCHIQDDLVRFDSAYEKLKQRFVKVKTLQNVSRN